jgi:hypothetical protein
MLVQPCTGGIAPSDQMEAYRVVQCACWNVHGGTTLHSSAVNMQYAWAQGCCSDSQGSRVVRCACKGMLEGETTLKSFQEGCKGDCRDRFAHRKMQTATVCRIGLWRLHSLMHPHSAPQGRAWGRGLHILSLDCSESGIMCLRRCAQRRHGRQSRLECRCGATTGVCTTGLCPHAAGDQHQITKGLGHAAAVDVGKSEGTA